MTDYLGLNTGSQRHGQAMFARWLRQEEARRRSNGIKAGSKTLLAPHPGSKKTLKRKRKNKIKKNHH